MDHRNPDRPICRTIEGTKSRELADLLSTRKSLRALRCVKADSIRRKEKPLARRQVSGTAKGLFDFSQ